MRKRYDRNGTMIDPMALPEEKTVKAMTKGEKCSPVTIHDIFAHRTEAQLTSKVMGKDAGFKSCFDKLKKDIKMMRESYYRGKDIRNGWELTLDEFMDLTAYYKAFFNGCTRDSMRLLLLQTRRDICNIDTADPNRYKKRKYKGTEGERYSDEKQPMFLCEAKDRLTPLKSTLYSNFFEYIARKRLGVVATTTYYFYLNERRAYDDKFIAPFITAKAIKFQYQNKDIDLHNWMSVTKENGREINTPSKLIELAAQETNIKSNKPLKPYTRRRR